MTGMIQPGEKYSILPDGRWEIYLDATMVGVFGKCPQAFEYSFIENLYPKGDRPFVRELGSWWSALMEVIYTNFAKNNKLEGTAVLAIATKLWDELKMDELEQYEPKKYKEFGGRYGALTMIADYATRQLPIDYTTWKIIAAEGSFGRNKEVKIGETDRIILYWLGQPDLYVLSSGRVFPVDHKQIGYIDAKLSKKYKPHIQIPGYIIAGQILCKSLGIDLPVDRAIINCVARADRTDKTGDSKYPRFKRVPVSYSPAELEEWKRKRLRDAESLRTCIESGEWDWRENACTNWFFRCCPYQNICEKPPEVRPIIIAADYRKRDPWIPGRTEKEMEKKGEVE